MKSITIVSAVVAVASAQQLVPTGLSTNCQTYVNALGTNDVVNKCTKAIASSSSAYMPGTSTTQATLSTVKSTLTTLCATPACQTSELGAELGKFWTACTSDLTASPPNADLLRTYDSLYIIGPMQTALCSKNGNADWCATTLSLTPSSGAAPGVNNAASAAKDTAPLVLGTTLSKRAAPVVVANATAYSTSNIAFFFLTKNLAKEQLCTDCTKNIMQAYTAFESAVPYGPGLGTKGSFLAGQKELYSGMSATCGASFFTQTGAKAVGAAGQGLFPGTSAASPSISAQGVVGIASAVVAVFLAISI